MYAGVIQLVECQLPKLDVAGSSPVARSAWSLRHLYLFLFVTRQVSLPASFSDPLEVIALRFARVVAISSPKDFHLQVNAHAGHTTAKKTRRIIGGVCFSNANGQQSLPVSLAVSQHIQKYPSASVQRWSTSNPAAFTSLASRASSYL